MSLLNALNARSLLPEPVSAPASKSLAGGSVDTTPDTAAGNTKAGSSSANGTASKDKVSLSDYGQLLAQGQDALSQRAQGLGSATANLAQNLLSQFAGNLFGDAGKGLQISFDDASISSQSTFSAARQRTSGANGSSDAAGFRLEDASSFVGHGKITTADGRSFDFEVEVRYQSVIQGAAATASSGPAAGDAKQLPPPPPADGKPPATPQGQGFGLDFAGTTADLLKSLTSDPVRLPFSFALPDSSDAAQSTKAGANGGGDLKSLIGDLLVRLTNLQGGPDTLDLSAKPAAQDDAPKAGRVDLKA